MDSAYDAQAIHEDSRSLGHVALIDTNPRRDTARKAELQAEEKRRRLLGYKAAEDREADGHQNTKETVKARVAACPPAGILVSDATKQGPKLLLRLFSRG
jgi:hypothetical protein